MSRGQSLSMMVALARPPASHMYAPDDSHCGLSNSSMTSKTLMGVERNRHGL
jgi:hypothetical protein